jgi:hypothetical protein
MFKDNYKGGYMKLLIKTLLIVLILATTSCADNASHRASAEEFLLAMKTDKMMKPVMKEMENMMVNVSKQMGIPEEESDLLNRHMSRMLKLIEDEFGWDKIKDDFITAYQETYTEDELRTFTAFFKSPAGQIYTDKMPLLMKKTMEITQKNMPAIMEKMQVLQAQMFEDIQNEIAKKQSQKKK